MQIDVIIVIVVVVVVVVVVVFVTVVIVVVFCVSVCDIAALLLALSSLWCPVAVVMVGARRV